MMHKHFDPGSIVVIVITFLLFILALFTKGLTHDILLEAGVLLVSIKLIMMAYRTRIYFEEILKEVKTLQELLNKNP